jgi:hypothetical protein
MSTYSINVNVQTHAGRPHNTLWLRIGFLLIFVITLVLVLISFLNYSNYRKTYSELNLTRYLIAAKDLRQLVVNGLNVGLNPAENVHLSPAIKEIKSQENRISFIAVMDESGDIISEGEIPKNDADRWRLHLNDTLPDASWQSSDRIIGEIGIPYMNNFNVKAGVIVIGYDKAAIESSMEEMLRKLGLDVAMTLFFLVALTLACVYLLTYKFSTQLSIVENVIDNALSGQPSQGIDGEFLDDGMAQGINEFTVLTHKVVKALSTIEEKQAQSGSDAHDERENVE